MDRLSDLEAFLAIIERGSQTAAARSLQRSLQAVSRSLAVVEQSLGVELVRRTTRRSRATEAGMAFYRQVKPALAAISDARTAASDSRIEPSGRLRISAPVLFAPAYVAPAVCEFMQRHPRIEVELRVSDGERDLLDEDIDLAVRIRHLRDSRLKARRIGEIRIVVFGTPDYFARHGRPRHPDELLGHHCVVRLTDEGAEPWPFMIGGRRCALAVRGRFATDSAASAQTMVANGLGIGVAPLWHVRSLVERGTVEIVLQDFEVERIPIQVVTPATRIPAVKARLFTDLLAERIKLQEL